MPVQSLTILMQIKKAIQESIEVKQRMLQDDAFLNNIQLVCNMMVNVYRNDGKILFCGNGGSAADAQHIAAELSGRFGYDRPPLFAEALHVNSSYLTAVANDYSFDEIYARLVQAFGKKKDILIGISTSGSSRNVIKALETAKQKEMFCIGFCGKNPAKMKDLCDVLIEIPSSSTARIQEAHILVGHILCEMVELAIFPR